MSAICSIFKDFRDKRGQIVAEKLWVCDSHAGVCWRNIEEKPDLIKYICNYCTQADFINNLYMKGVHHSLYVNIVLKNNIQHNHRLSDSLKITTQLLVFTVWHVGQHLNTTPMQPDFSSGRRNRDHFKQFLWFNSSRQLSTTELITHSPTVGWEDLEE